MAKPEVFRFAINGREIFGIRRRRRDGKPPYWKFTCDSWPDIQKRFPREHNHEKAVEEFVRRELHRIGL